MNKYQEALNVLKKIEAEKNYKLIGLFNHPQCDTLQELVDKETPKKFKIKTDKDGRVIWVCPKCGQILMKFWSDVETIRPFNYCDECGQRLDWEVENDKNIN